MRHYSIDPVEIAWSGLKDYVRKNNTSFSIKNIHQLVTEFIAGFDGKAAQAAIRHTEKLKRRIKQRISF